METWDNRRDITSNPELVLYHAMTLPMKSFRRKDTLELGYIGTSIYRIDFAVRKRSDISEFYYTTGNVGVTSFLAHTT